jgi:hypothetical protein
VESTIEKMNGRVPVTGAFDSNKRPSKANTGLGAGSALCAKAMVLKQTDTQSVQTESSFRKLKLA